MKRFLLRMAGSTGFLLAVLAPAAVIGIGGCLWFWYASVPPLSPDPGVPVPHPGTGGPSGSPPPNRPRDAVELRLLRSRDELLLFARRTDFGLPAEGAAVRLLDGAGEGLKEGRTDGHGVYRGNLPPAAVSVEVTRGEGAVLRPLPPAPEPPPPDLPFLVDRSVIRPGDRVRLLLLGGERPPPPPRLMLVDGAGGEVEGVSLEPAEDPAVEEPWVLFQGWVPDDAPPGRARLSAGGAPLGSLPVVARFGEAAPRGGGGGPDLPPDPPPEPGDLRFRDGRWHLAVPGAEPGAEVLFVLLSGDRLLSHTTVPVERGEGAAALTVPAGTPSPRIRAVAMTPRGFLEAGADAPAPGGGPRLHIEGEEGGGLRTVLLLPPEGAPEGAPGPAAAIAVVAEDPTGRRPFTVLAAAASSYRLTLRWTSPLGVWSPGMGPDPTDGIPARFRAVAAGGGLPALLRRVEDAGSPAGGPGKVVPLEPGRVRVGEWTTTSPAFSPPGLSVVSRIVEPGRDASWPGRGRAARRDSVVRWTVDAPPGSSGPLRLTCGGGIVLEASVSDVEEGGGGAGGRSGEIEAGLLTGGPLRLEARVPGLRGLLLEGPAAPAPADAPPAGEGLAIRRLFPAGAARGEVGEAGVVLEAEGPCGPLVVHLPLPGGTVPVEDGWEMRARCPEGTRVEFDRNPHWGVARAVRWRLPGLPAGETRLTLRLRAVAPGDYAAPAATADSVDPTGPWARSAAGRLVVE